MSLQTLDVRGWLAGRAGIQVCPSYWICVFNFFPHRCVSSFFQVELYFIFLARDHFIIPTFPILASSAQCIKTLFTPLLRSLRHRTGWVWGQAVHSLSCARSRAQPATRFPFWKGFLSHPHKTKLKLKDKSKNIFLLLLQNKAMNKYLLITIEYMATPWLSSMGDVKKGNFWHLLLRKL